jgi:hypothetical protein
MLGKVLGTLWQVAWVAIGASLVIDSARKTVEIWENKTE